MMSSVSKRVRIRITSRGFCSGVIEGYISCVSSPMFFFAIFERFEISAAYCTACSYSIEFHLSGMPRNGSDLLRRPTVFVEDDVAHYALLILEPLQHRLDVDVLHVLLQNETDNHSPSFS
jgi:hypothetical protein